LQTHPVYGNGFRQFNNLYLIYKPKKSTQFYAGFDVGNQFHDNKVHTWYTSVLIIRQPIFDKWSISGRLEQYKDPGGIILQDFVAKNGISSFSFNIDYTLSPFIFRTEIRK